MARGRDAKNTSITRFCAPAKRGWREVKKFLNYSFLHSRGAWLARGQQIPQLLVLALPQSGVGARPNKYPNYSFLRPREARVARGQPIPRLLVSALPRSVLGARPTNISITRFGAPAKRGWREAKQSLNYSLLRSRGAWLARGPKIIQLLVFVFPRSVAKVFISGPREKNQISSPKRKKTNPHTQPHTSTPP